MAQFYNSNPDEQETIVNIDYSASLVSIYTCRKAVYDRLFKKLGQPADLFYTNKKISGGRWTIAFSDKKTLTSVLSRPLLIGSVT